MTNVSFLYKSSTNATNTTNTYISIFWKEPLQWLKNSLLFLNDIKDQIHWNKLIWKANNAIKMVEFVELKKLNASNGLNESKTSKTPKTSKKIDNLTILKPLKH